MLPAPDCREYKCTGGLIQPEIKGHNPAVRQTRLMPLYNRGWQLGLSRRIAIPDHPRYAVVVGLTLTTEQQIQAVLTALSQVLACANCGARFRFGDLDCPHCGAELDEYFRQWALELLRKLGHQVD